MSWGTMYLRCDQSVVNSLGKKNRRAALKSLEICLIFAAASLGAELHAEYSEADYAGITTAQEKKLNEIRDEEVAQIKIILRRSISKEQRADHIQFLKARVESGELLDVEDVPA